MAPLLRATVVPPPVSACLSPHAMYLNVFGWFGSRSYTRNAHQHDTAAGIAAIPQQTSVLQAVPRTQPLTSSGIW